MIVAQKKRRENIIEYLLYMWQVEDLIRAANVTEEGIENLILPRYQGDEEMLQSIRAWYKELIDMMRTESKQKGGHLDINRIVLLELEELHQRLSSNPEDTPCPHSAERERNEGRGARHRDATKCRLWLHNTLPTRERDQ